MFNIVNLNVISNCTVPNLNVIVNDIIPNLNVTTNYNVPNLNVTNSTISNLNVTNGITVSNLNISNGCTMSNLRINNNGTVQNLNVSNNGTVSNLNVTNIIYPNIVNRNGIINKTLTAGVATPIYQMASPDEGFLFIYWSNGAALLSYSWIASTNNPAMNVLTNNTVSNSISFTVNSDSIIRANCASGITVVVSQLKFL